MLAPKGYDKYEERLLDFSFALSDLVEEKLKDIPEEMIRYYWGRQTVANKILGD